MKYFYKLTIYSEDDLKPRGHYSGIIRASNNPAKAFMKLEEGIIKRHRTRSICVDTFHKM